MTEKTPISNINTDSDGETSPANKKREYEKSGFYPKGSKPFRVWALLGILTGVMVLLAAISALLNFILI